MKRAADTGTDGLELVNEGWVTDLDFADDIALLDSNMGRHGRSRR
jgi:hypothetical protein